MNRITINKLLIIFLEVFIALVLWNVVIVNRELEDPTRVGKMGFFLWIIVPIALIFIVNLLVQGINYFTSISVFAVLFMIFAFFTGKIGGIWKDEKILYFLGCLVVVLSVSYMVAFQKQHRL